MRTNCVLQRSLRRCCDFATLPAMRAWIIAAITATTVLACGSEDERPDPEPTYRDQIGPLMAERCGSCHQGDAAAGGWRATTYSDVIGCLPDGTSAVAIDAAGDARILRALTTETHKAVADTRDAIARWVRAGARPSNGHVHPAGFLDPRSPESHGRFLKDRRYAPMLDAADRDACGVCHEGAPARPEKATTPAARATACTTCHSEPQGVSACTTCHGTKGKAYPPRSACFNPGAKADTSHAVHVEPGPLHKVGFECKTCHPVPESGRPVGVHIDGFVEVWEVGFTAEKTCMNQCHTRRDGALPQPKWNESKMACNSCHGAPPTNHYKGACSNCHHDVNADATALKGLGLHMNGKVDVGSGTGTGCGQCHGTGDDPWPTTGAHQKHKTPTFSAPVPCSTCHDVPTSMVGHPRGTGVAAVRLLGLATRGGISPKYDYATKSCSAVYCHSRPATPDAVREPKWDQGPAAVECGKACHSVPPPAPHPASTGCGAALCHNGAVSGGVLTPAGAAKHVNGNIDM